MSTSHEGLAAPPAGLGLLVLVASVAVRAAALERVDAEYMLWCGLLQDWKASVGWSLALWALPLALLREAATAAALVHLVIDFGLQATAGIRMHSDAWALVVDHLISVSKWQTLLKNGAMVPAAAWVGLLCLIPLGVCLRLERFWRPRVTLRGGLAVATATALALAADPPCCRDGCSAELELAQAPNGLAVLLDDAWAAIGPHAASAAAAPPRDSGAASLNSTLSTQRTAHRRRRRGGGGGGNTSRNVVLITLESVGAVHAGLVGPGLRRTTMPFLHSLTRRRRPRVASVVEDVYASEPNTLHAFYASHCGLRPYLGVRRAEYEVARYHNACLPTLLRRGGIHSALYSTSRLSFQRDLGFDSVWSSMLTDEASSRPTYNFLGHDDFSGLHAIETFVRTVGAQQRFFLSLLTLNTHSPYTPSDHPAGTKLLWGCDRLWQRGGRLGNDTNFSVPLPRPTNYSERALRAATGSIEGAREADPPSRSDKVKAAMERDASAYARELRCADSYLQAVWQILERAGLLEDTTVLISADHGEGFMQSHHSDAGHGGAVYDTQVRIPLVIAGAGADALPARVGGVWSETAIAPTVLEMMGMPPHPLAGSAALQSIIDLEGGGDGDEELEQSDLLGASLVSRWRDPPSRAYMSCAFESSCVGLRRPLTKYVWRGSGRGDGAGGHLEVFYRGDTYEEIDLASQLDAAERREVVSSMLRWARAVNALHEGPRVENHVCPFDSPFRFIFLFTHYTHCCPVKPTSVQYDMYRRRFQRCPKPHTPVQCSTPPCVDDRKAVAAYMQRARKEAQAAGDALRKERTQARAARARKEQAARAARTQAGQAGEASESHLPSLGRGRSGPAAPKRRHLPKRGDERSHVPDDAAGGAVIRHHAAAPAAALRRPHAEARPPARARRHIPAPAASFRKADSRTRPPPAKPVAPDRRGSSDGFSQDSRGRWRAGGGRAPTPEQCERCRQQHPTRRDCLDCPPRRGGSKEAGVLRVHGDVRASEAKEGRRRRAARGTRDSAVTAQVTALRQAIKETTAALNASAAAVPGELGERMALMQYLKGHPDSLLQAAIEQHVQTGMGIKSALTAGIEDYRRMNLSIRERGL